MKEQKVEMEGKRNDPEIEFFWVLFQEQDYLATLHNPCFLGIRMLFFFSQINISRL